MATLKTGYHHGDLRTALIDAGLALTRTGGPEALTIREATRRAGVSPNAAYRHFVDREALLSAVATAIQHRMAARMAATSFGRPRRGGSAARGRPGLHQICTRRAGVVHGGILRTPIRSALTTKLPAHHHIWRWSMRSMRWWMRASSALSDAKALNGRAGLRCTGLPNSPCGDRCVMPRRREVEVLAGRTVDDIIAGLSRRTR